MGWISSHVEDVFVDGVVADFGKRRDADHATLPLVNLTGSGEPPHEPLNDDD
jgi:hypothetical protein